MAKVKDAFAGKKANIGYVVAGYPSVEATKEFLLNLDGSCLDLLELGIPYSDPLADGKLIAQASFETAAKGINTGAIFAMLEECKGKINKPVIFLVYFNIVFAYGVERFIARSKEVGIAGFIIPDLPFEESEEIAGLWSQRASKERLKALVEGLKKRSELPVAVGFGVKNKNDADEVKTYADGAIIGTEIVKLTAKFEGEELIKQINKLF